MVYVRAGQHPAIDAMPGSTGTVCVTTPIREPEERARYVLGALAYGLHDLVARESVRGVAWAKPAPPKGRPKALLALNNAERQRRYRARLRLNSPT